MGFLLLKFYFTAGNKSIHRKYTCLTIILLGRCLDTMHLAKFIPSFKIVLSNAKRSFSSVLPLIVSLWAIFHIFAFLGIYLFGKVSIPQAELAPLYNLLGFKSYFGSILTLFNLLVVNNWNLIANPYVKITKSLCTAVYFLCFNMIAVTICLSSITALFVLNFMSYIKEEEDISTKTPEVVTEASKRSLISNINNNTPSTPPPVIKKVITISPQSVDSKSFKVSKHNVNVLNADSYNVFLINIVYYEFNVNLLYYI